MLQGARDVDIDDKAVGRLLGAVREMRDRSDRRQSAAAAFSGAANPSITKPIAIFDTTRAAMAQCSPMATRVYRRSTLAAIMRYLFASGAILDALRCRPEIEIGDITDRCRGFVQLEFIRVPYEM
jgi:hypothetical protein